MKRLKELFSFKMNVTKKKKTNNILKKKIFRLEILILRYLLLTSNK